MANTTSTYEISRTRSEGAQVRTATLVVHAPDGAVVVPLTTAALVIGRQPPSDVRVDDSSLSRQHARFTLTDAGLLVEDLGSTNGTRLNGQSVHQAVAQPGELIELGTVDVFFHARRPASEDRSAPPSDVARSAAMQELNRWIRRAAAARSPVLIQGETGTGKERVAHALHAFGPRTEHPLRIINCAAIPDTLAEGLLFGHERGAFTGASTSQPGLFEQAQKGTLFLDEIGDLPPRIQAMLLRVLETKRVSRIGSSRETTVDVRIVAATHRDLDAMVHAGEFREDLLYRLNALTLRVPPLRERREEIVPLAEELLVEVGREWNGAATSFSPAALEALVAYHWPGNVRQLRNVVERSLLVCRGTTIELSDLPVALRKPSAETALGERPAPSPEGATSKTPPARTFREQVQAFEIQLIHAALLRSGGNQRAASRELGIPLRTLFHKIKAYGLREVLDGSEDES